MTLYRYTVRVPCVAVIFPPKEPPLLCTEYFVSIFPKWPYPIPFLICNRQVEDTTSVVTIDADEDELSLEGDCYIKVE